MALGQYQVNILLDTATDPDDTEVIAAPGAGQRIHVHWWTVVVTTGQANSIVVLEDGAGGDALFAIDSSSNFSGTAHEEFPVCPLRLTENTALNGSIVGATGVVARVLVSYEVKGW